MRSSPHLLGTFSGVLCFAMAGTNGYDSDAPSSKPTRWRSGALGAVGEPQSSRATASAAAVAQVPCEVSPEPDGGYRSLCLASGSPAAHWAAPLAKFFDAQQSKLGGQSRKVKVLSLCTGMMAEAMIAEVFSFASSCGFVVLKTQRALDPEVGTQKC